MKKFKTVLSILTLGFFATIGIATAAPDLSGTVKATMSGDGYTYVKIETAEGKIWVAVPETNIARGSTVKFKNGIPTENLTSADLDTTFKKIFISTGIAGSVKSSPASVDAKPAQTTAKNNAEVAKSPDPKSTTVTTKISPFLFTGEGWVCESGDCEVYESGGSKQGIASLRRNKGSNSSD